MSKSKEIRFTLRKRVIYQLKNKRNPKNRPSGGKPGGLIRELQACQADLQAQREALLQTRQALAQTQEHYHNIFLQAPLGYMFLDKYGVIQNVNQAFCVLVRFPAEQIRGRPIFEIIAEKDRPAFIANYEAFYTNPAGKRVEIDLLTGDQAQVRVSLQAVADIAAHTDGSTEIGDRLLVSMSDITEQVQVIEALRQSEANLRAILHTALDGFWLIEPISGRFLEVNDAYCEMSGYSREELLNMRIADVEVIESEEDVRSHSQGIIERGFDRFESIHRKKDGSFFNVEVSVQRLEGEKGKHFAFIHNITQRKQTIESLRISEEQFRSYFELGSIGMAITSPDKHWVQFNDRLCEMLGYPREELGSLTWAEITHPDDLEKDEALFELVLAGGSEGFSLDKRFIRKDGSVIHTSLSTRCLRKSDGSPDRFVTMLADITERKQNVEALRRYLAELQTLYDNGLAISRLHDPHLIGQRLIETLAENLSWHHVAIRLRRDESDELELVAFNQPMMTETEKDQVGAHYSTLIHKFGQGLSGLCAQTGKVINAGDVQRFPEYIETYPGIQSGLYIPLTAGEQVIGVISVESETPNAFSAEDERLLGTLASQAAIAFDNARLYQSAQREIRDRKRVEEALRQRETDLVRAQAMAHMGNYSWNLQTNEFSASDELKNIWGLDQVKSFSQVFKHIHPEDRHRVIQASKNARKGEPHVQIEYRVLRPDGDTRYLADQAEVIFDRNGKAIRMVGSAQDMTERKLAEQALRKSEAEYRRLVSHLPIGVLVHSDGRILLVNHAGASILRAEGPDDLVGHTIFGLIPYEYQEIVKKRIEKMLATGSPAPLMEQALLRCDGTPVPAEITSLPLIYGGMPAILTVFNDITERREANKKLEDLLEEKDILLAEIHHRVKNNMQIIVSLLNLQSNETDDKRILAILQESRSRIHSMALVHEQLYRGREYSHIDFAQYLDSLASTLFNMYQVAPSQVDFSMQADHITLDLEKAIPCGLLFNELITNSLKYAFPGGRRGRISISIQQENGSLFIQFADDGVGLPQAVEIDTTRTLGLQLVQLLVTHDLHGHLTLERNPGTRFLINFPLAVAR